MTKLRQFYSVILAGLTLLPVPALALAYVQGAYDAGSYNGGAVFTTPPVGPIGPSR